jgi:hypothetical protein
MTIDERIKATYSEITDKDFDPFTGSILLKDDGDGIVYICKWDYSKPIPEGLSLGKP